MKSLLTNLLAVALLLLSAFSFGHGLTMSTAQITVRNHTHITVRVNYSPLHFIDRMTPEVTGEVSLPQLTSMSDEAFLNLYQDIQSLFLVNTSITYEGVSASSLNFRFPTVDSFRSSLREQFVRQVVGQAHDDNHAHGDERRYYQTLDIDGFLDETTVTGVLDIKLPAELGELYLSYSQPKTQIIKPVRNKIHYRQQIELE